MEIKQYGFFLNGVNLLKIVKCTDIKSAKNKLNFLYPINFNIQIKQIKTN